MQAHNILSIFGLSILVWFSCVDARAQQTQPKHPTISATTWSGDLNVPDPVAVSVDNQGRVFATQTRRRKIQDLDIREHREWIPEDVGLESVEQKRALYKEKLAIGGDQAQQKKWVKDVNQDGQYDWRDLTVISEVIYRLVDTDGDGVANEIETFSEDFKTEVTGIAAGVVALDGKVYATVAPDLWQLEDADEDGKADAKKSIATGFGLHVAYGGHDMHGPIVGPDGRIYWSIGDKGISATGPDGRKWHYPNQGGVMRCNPDGSDFEVFAHGLRNVQEFDWDVYGNMFGVDNDADQTDERERFVHIVEGMDAGWRCNYQYRGSLYNPWTDEKLWQLPGKDHPAYIVPPIQHYIDGPAGFKLNPGTALSESYENYFFLTGAPNGYQYAFRVEPSGDSFVMKDDHLFASGRAIVGLAFGPDGALYGADWDGGYPLDEIGSIARFDVPAGSAHPLRGEVKGVLGAGFGGLEDAELVTLLSHADRRVRHGAQFELVNRKKAYELCTTARDEALSTVTRLHALWGSAQLARKGDTLARDTLGILLKDDDAHIRGQAAKSYAEVDTADGSAVVALLEDKDLHVRTLAGLALARKPTKKATEKLLELAGSLTADQHYLRHSIVSALAACATAEQLESKAADESEMRRLCCVLALRRVASEKVAKYLNDDSDWVATAAARAIHDDFSIPAAMDELADSLLKRKSGSEAFVLRAINANYRIGDAAAANRLVQYASSATPEYTQHALDALAAWMTPPLLDRIDGRRRKLTGSRSVDPQSLGPKLAKLLDHSNAGVQTKVIDATRHLGLQIPEARLRSLLASGDADPGLRVAALNMLVASAGNSVRVAAESGQSQLQLAAIAQLGLLPPEAAVELAGKLLASENSAKVRQASVGFLATRDSSEAEGRLVALAKQVAAGNDAELALDVLLAADSKQLAPELLNKIRAIGVANGVPEKLAEFGLAIEGGDAEVGLDLFQTHIAAQCARCHKIGKSGSDIGPELTNIASKRDAKHLLQSVVQPSAEIDAKYRKLMLLLDSDDVVSGVLVEKTDTVTTIANEKGELIEIPNDEIIQSKEETTSLMPEITGILSPSEVRDVIAYLKSLK